MVNVSCFQSGSIVDGLESKNKFDAIRELLNRAELCSSQDTLREIEQAVIARERIYTTGIGHGVAIAHGKTPGLDEVVVLLGISRSGINFDAVDGKPVHLLFLIAHPPEKCDDYMTVLSTIARIMHNGAFNDALCTELNTQMVGRLIAKEFSASLEGRLNN